MHAYMHMERDTGDFRACGSACVQISVCACACACVRASACVCVCVCCVCMCVVCVFVCVRARVRMPVRARAPVGSCACVQQRMSFHCLRACCFFCACAYGRAHERECMRASIHTHTCTHTRMHDVSLWQTQPAADVSGPSPGSFQPALVSSGTKQR